MNSLIHVNGRNIDLKDLKKGDVKKIKDKNGQNIKITLINASTALVEGQSSVCTSPVKESKITDVRARAIGLVVDKNNPMSIADILKVLRGQGSIVASVKRSTAASVKRSTAASVKRSTAASVRRSREAESDGDEGEPEDEDEGEGEPKDEGESDGDGESAGEDDAETAKKKNGDGGGYAESSKNKKSRLY